MTGIVIATHCKLGEALIDSAEFILGKRPEGVMSISIDLKDNPEKLFSKISNAIKKVNKNKGVLILTDMFGGTPSNLSYSFLEEGRVEVLSGVNLPVLIKALRMREEMTLDEFAKPLEEFGKKSISLASGILKGQSRS
jgi:PTS system mannose-specific IIA component